MAVPVTTVPRLRQNIFSLQTKYDHGQDDEKKPMEKLLWAFHYIQKHIDSKNYDSYFKIAGYHGMPFRGAGWENPAWWGGYCTHGNVLFPTWHRAYLLRLENALRRVEGCADVALPYWDETSETTQNYGIPDIFLRKQVTIPTSIAKGSCSTSGNTKITIHNPLRSYKFQDGVWNNLNPVPDSNYSKPKGYETKRYPFSGLVDSNDIGATVQHNKFVALLGDKGTENLLNQNVINWPGQSITLSTGEVLKMNTAFKYQECLKAPTYTVFSNTTSATQYNEDHYYDNVEEGTYAPKAPTLPTVSLEGPHNDIHLAIGGFDIPGLGTFDSIIGANGDMGENETAAFDPIFYFHHCFIDKVFWEWQKNWGCKEKLEIDVGYPGTNSVDYQGPTPGVPGNAWLTMETPLAPFTKDDKEVGPPLTSNDVVDIVNQLKYTYDPSDISHASNSQPQAQIVRITGINRATIQGSFLIVVRAEIDGVERVVGTESVLSRWKVSGCANCQTHLNVKAFVPLVALDEKALSTVKVGLHMREKRIDDINNTPMGRGWRLGNLKPMEALQN